MVRGGSSSSIRFAFVIISLFPVLQRWIIRISSLHAAFRSFRHFTLNFPFALLIFWKKPLQPLGRVTGRPSPGIHSVARDSDFLGTGGSREDDRRKIYAWMCEQFLDGLFMLVVYPKMLMCLPPIPDSGTLATPLFWTQETAWLGIL